MDSFTPTADAIVLEPCDDVHRASGFVAKLTVGGNGALLTRSALESIFEHGGNLLAAELNRDAQRRRDEAMREGKVPPTGTITSTDTGTRRA